MAKKNLLLHVCCAPCSTHVIEELKAEYEITLFFYNPNVHPKEEYEKRLIESKRYAYKIGINQANFIEGEYDPINWFDFIKGLEDEPEHGKRCIKCFEMRLNRTAQYAKKNGFDIFACTLTISPYKKKDNINEIGKSIGERYKIAYLESDFKKRDGYKKSIELCKIHNIYRQNYCGCVFSMRR
jgi:predicted adenine nucleotide alpha hydrolase (AANH) superfamily ATPase